MLTTEALQKRKSMKTNQGIILLMRNWWDSTMALSEEETAIAGNTHNVSCSGGTRELSKAQYVRLSEALHEMLEPGVTSEETRAAAEEDWAQDMAHNPEGSMTFGQFFDSMFELCDTWVSLNDTAKSVF